LRTETALVQVLGGGESEHATNRKHGQRKRAGARGGSEGVGTSFLLREKRDKATADIEKNPPKKRGPRKNFVESAPEGVGSYG